jgi:hypothetical protein
MVHFANSVYSGINSIAIEYNKSDLKWEEGSGKKTTRNYIPIGTGTLFKLNALGVTALFIVLIPRMVTGCYRDENQNELICRVINYNIKTLGCAVVTNVAFQGYRVFRNLFPEGANA